MTTKQRNFGYVNVIIACGVWTLSNLLRGDYLQGAAWFLMALAALLELEPSAD